MKQKHTKYTKQTKKIYAQRNRPIVTIHNPENCKNHASKCESDYEVSTQYNTEQFR